MIISVMGWRNPRKIVFRDEKVYLEIGELRSCKICQDRVRDMKNFSSQKDLQIDFWTLEDRFPKNGPTLWVGIENPKNGKILSQKEIQDLFWEYLGLEILRVW